MGNDENTIKVPAARRELGVEPKAYCRRHGPAVPGGLACARHLATTTSSRPARSATTPAASKFIQAVYDAGDIYKGTYDGPLLHRLRGVQDREGGGGRRRAVPQSPNTPLTLGRGGELLLPPLGLPRSAAGPLRGASRIHPAREPAQRDRQPGRDPSSRTSPSPARGSPGASRSRSTRSRRSTSGSTPCSTTSPAIGYGTDEERFRQLWPADVHVIGKDITRFHCALWPAMLMSAGLPLPRSGLRPRLRLPQERGDRRGPEAQQEPGQRRRADGADREVLGRRRSAITS